ncbi:MAG: DNA polymerase III subunit delta [Prevotella sp.]|jgi:DNA polymerase-3 subunit delta
MPEKKPVVTYDAIMSQLKKGEYAPVYLLMGDESYYIDNISNYIQEHALSPEEQAFNQTVVFGADITVGKIADLAMSYPMMAQRRVVIVKEAQNVRSLDKLDKYVEKPLATTVLVICYKNGTVDRRQKWVGAVGRNGVVFESNKLRDWQLPNFIQKWLVGHKVAVDPKSASMIAEHVGPDLNRLTSELEKLLVALPADDRRVTPELVERNIGVSKDYNWFELRDALANKNVFKANQIMKYFTDNQRRDGFYTLLPSLFSFFQNLMIAYYAPNRNDPVALAEELGLRSRYGTQSYLTAMRNYTAMKTLQILDKIGETDAKVKGFNNPNTSISDLMQELVFFILH